MVPTWNYVLVHAHGRLVVHDDVEWLETNVRRLTDTHEAQAGEPWSVDDAPRRYIDGQLKAIVGIEVLLDRVVGKWKLGQNRSDEDIAGAIEGLEAAGRARRLRGDAGRSPAFTPRTLTAVDAAGPAPGVMSVAASATEWARRRHLTSLRVDSARHPRV